MKKIISILLSVLLIFPALPAFAEGEPPSANDYEYFLEAHELLTGLGCQKVDTKKDGIITRDAWINLATKFSHYENVSRLNLAGAGIHSDTNYYFLPENPIKVRDAVVMLVKLLGYQPGVEYADTVYIKTAMTLDIDEGLNVNFDDYVTYETAYILLYNFLKADTAEVSYSTTDVNIKKGDTNLLYEKFNIVELYGQVTWSPSYSISSQEGADDGYIRIGDKLCTNLRYDGDEYFGRYVTAYVKNYDSSNAEVVSLHTDDKSKVSILKSEDCVSFDDGTLSYYEASGKTKSIKISLSADVYQNGKPFDFDESIIPESGSITIIDNDVYGDGADVVLIDRTVDVKISALTPSDYTVYSSDVPGTKLVIDEDVKLLEPSGIPYDFENLTIGDVLTVWYKNDMSIWKAVWNNYSFSDVISGVGDKGVEIAEKKYSFSKSRYDFFKDKIIPGENVTVLLNIYGEICDVTSSVTTDGTPGVMLALANMKKGLSQSLSMKLYTVSDGIIVYPVSENVLINGKKYKTMDEVDNAFEKFAGTENEVQKFVVFKLNEDKTVITSVDFASEIPMDVDGESRVYLTKTIDESDKITGKYRRYSKILGYDITVEPSTTTLFRIPKQSKTGELYDEPDFYKNSKFASVQSGTIYSECRIKAYTLDPTSKVSQFVTIEYDVSDGSSDTPEAGTRASLVGEISKTIHDDEETEAVVIYNYTYPNGVTVYGKTPTYFTDLGVESGDIIHLDYNSTTKMAKAVRILWKKGADTLANNTVAFGEEGGITDIRYCKVYKLWGTVADMFYNNEDMSGMTTDDAMIFRTDLFQIFKYDERTKTVSITNANEFMPYVVAGEENCSRVIVEVRYRESVSMFLVD